MWQLGLIDLETHSKNIFGGKKNSDSRLKSDSIPHFLRKQGQIRNRTISLFLLLDLAVLVMGGETHFKKKVSKFTKTSNLRKAILGESEIIPFTLLT